MVAVEHVRAVVDRADILVGDVLAEMPVPGLGVGVVHAGELVYARGVGKADIESGRDVDVDTVFRIGSISKTFVAIAVLQLRDRGLVELDDPLGRHLHDWRIATPADSAAITLRDLLTHRSGVGEIRGLSDLWRRGGRLSWDSSKRPLPDLASFYEGGFSADVPVGDKWAYANHAFGTLGHVVETVSGQAFDGYMIDNVFTPLGMDSSDFVRSERVTDRLATGYKPSRRHGPKEVNYRDIVIPGAGSIFSTVNDMARYLAAVVGEGANDHGRVLKEDSFAELFAPQWRLDERLGFEQGLAFMLDRAGGHRVAHHGGAWHGFISFLIAAPDRGVGVVAFANHKSLAPYEVAHRLLYELLDAPDPRKQVPVAGVREPAEVWPDLLGAYAPAPGLLTNFRVHQTFGGQVDIVIRDGHLAIRGLVGALWKPARLYPLDADDPLRYRAIVTVGDTEQALDVAFVRDPDGTVITLNLQMLLPMRLHRRSRIKDLRTWAKILGGAAAASLAGWRLARRFH